MPFRKRTLLAAMLGLASASTTYAAVDLQVTEIWMGNDPGDNLTEDWFEIVNAGDEPWVSGVDAPLYYEDDSRNPDNAELITGIDSIAPGEAVIVVVSNDADDAIDFHELWSPVYELAGVKIGLSDGPGLGQGGDAVTLYLGTPSAATEVDFEAYPDANDSGGQSWNPETGAFSMTGDLAGSVATAAVNDEGQPAIGTPGNLGAVLVVGDFPEISLLGDDPLILTLGDSWADPGATAADTEDGELTGSIVVSGDLVETTETGEYAVNYDVTDSDGNAAATVTRNVVVTWAERISDAPYPADPDLFVHVATLGESDGLTGAEIPAYDRISRQAYITSGDGLQIVSLADPYEPEYLSLIDPSTAPFDLDSAAVTSVDVCGGIVAFAVPADTQTDPGSVVFTDSAGVLLDIVTVGALPDMLVFTDDCETVLVANEGEPDDGIDPEGSVSIIDVASGSTRTVDFTRFNGLEASLEAQGVRLFPGVAAANDFEPEYIAVSQDRRLAYVTLQEANTVAVIDIRRARVTELLPLGLKDHSKPGNELDASDRDFVINMTSWPLLGMYMPDAIAAYRQGRHQYFITANEGDARNADVRAAELELDPVAFPAADVLLSDFAIGRIDVSDIDGDTDGDGDYDELHSYGARSFTIWDERGNIVYDSGSDIEAIVHTYDPDNADDGRSDNKGPEPEGVEIGSIGNSTYAFIGLERTDNVLVYDISSPAAPRFVQLLKHEGDEAPEGLHFLSRGESPNQCPTLLVTNEDSASLSIYQMGSCTDKDRRGKGRGHGHGNRGWGFGHDGRGDDRDDGRRGHDRKGNEKDRGGSWSPGR